MARRRASRRLRPPRKNHCDVPDRLPYPCYFVCADCGWLEDAGPSAGGNDPHRRSAEPRTPGACPSCGATAWVDLGLQSVALNYREAETASRDLERDRDRGLGVWVGLLMSIVGTAALGLTTINVATHPVLLTALGLAIWLVTAWVMSAWGRHAQSGRARPRRWRSPLPRPCIGSPLRSVTQGVVEGEDALTSPLGGHQCLGWSVRVWSDEGLLLEEQHHAPLSVDGQSFAADTVTLDLAPRGALSFEANDPAIAQFLRRRGLSPHDASLRIYEAHVMPDVPVALHYHGRDGGPLLSQAPRQLEAV